MGLLNGKLKNDICKRRPRIQQQRLFILQSSRRRSRVLSLQSTPDSTERRVAGDDDYDQADDGHTMSGVYKEDGVLSKEMASRAAERQDVREDGQHYYKGAHLIVRFNQCQDLRG